MQTAKNKSLLASLYGNRWRARTYFELQKCVIQLHRNDRSSPFVTEYDAMCGRSVLFCDHRCRMTAVLASTTAAGLMIGVRTANGRHEASVSATGR